MAYISFQPSDFFNVNLWTGNSTTDRAMTGIGFQPDFLWNKSRNETYDHHLQDAVRGSTEYLDSNDTGIEATNAEGVKSFNADGFTLGNANDWNQTAKTYVGWSWKGGTTTGITTDGSTTITPSAYSFNQTSGFSVLKYAGNSTSGAKVAHGLGATPEMVLVKNLETANDWSVYHKNSNAVPEDYTLQLNTTALSADNAGMWNDTAPDAVNITLGNDNGVNGGYDYVAYCFASKKGYSKFGPYTGNGNDDGPFIYTGFRPAFVITKSSTASANSWYMMDRLRTNPYNPQDGRLEADGGGAEQSTPDMDLCSNGFKLRALDGGFNTSGTGYIYMAFAEFPLVSSNSKAGTAR